jgi:hypothetical protein
MALKKIEERELAKRYFIEDKLSFTEIALKINVNQKTVRIWAKEDKWLEINRSLLVTKDVQIANLYEQLEWINSAIRGRESKIASLKEAEIISKITTSICKLEIETSTGEAIEVLKRFLTFLWNTDQKLMQYLQPTANAFIKSLFK